MIKHLCLSNQIRTFTLKMLVPRLRATHQLTAEKTEVIDNSALTDLLARLEKLPRTSLALLPTPIQPLKHFGALHRLQQYPGRAIGRIYGVRLLARKEGLIADPVYKGRAIHGLLNLSAEGRFEKNAKILLMHLGGSPAIQAYAEYFGPVHLQKL